MDFVCRQSGNSTRNASVIKHGYRDCLMCKSFTFDEMRHYILKS